MQKIANPLVVTFIFCIFCICIFCLVFLDPHSALWLDYRSHCVYLNRLFQNNSPECTLPLQPAHPSLLPRPYQQQPTDTTSTPATANRPHLAPQQPSQPSLSHHPVQPPTHPPLSLPSHPLRPLTPLSPHTVPPTCTKEEGSPPKGENPKP